MLEARRLRGWLRTTNLVLIAGLLGVLGRLGLERAPAPLPAGAWDTRAPDPERATPERAADAVDLDAFLADLRRFHGAAGDDALAAGPAAPASTEEGPLPLVLFRIATVLAQPGGRTVVQIVSKDPARPESHALVQGEVVGGIGLERVDLAPDLTRATVSRGAERVDLVLDRRDWHLDRFVRPVARGRTPPVRATRPDVPTAPSGSSRAGPVCAGDPGLRTVPYRDGTGAIVGLRVTGIDPQGPWAATGLRAGEAILALDGAVVTDPRDVARRWREGRGAREALVRDVTHPQAPVRTLVLP